MMTTANGGIPREERHDGDLKRARSFLMVRLSDRPKRFVEDGDLVPTDTAPDAVGDPDDCSSNS